MRDKLDDLLGIDTNDSTQQLALDLVESDQRLMRALVQLRRANGVTQEEVGRRMGVTQPAVAALERADADPKLSTLRRYALALGAFVEHKVVQRFGTSSDALEPTSPSATGNAVSARVTAKQESSLLKVCP